MRLHLGHEFLLLYLDDTSGKGDLSSTRLGYTFMGALVAEWLFDGTLAPDGANRFRVTQRESPWPSMRHVLRDLADASLSYRDLLDAVYGWVPSDRYDLALGELQGLGLLRPVDDTLFGFTWRTRWPMVDGRVEAIVVERLRQHLASYQGPPHLDDALVSLLRASDQLGSVWSVAEQEALRPRIVVSSGRAPIGKEVRSAFLAREAAEAAVVVM
jgi:hypothetical protein